MRALITPLLLLPALAPAQWVKFDACGLKSSDDPPYEVLAGKAPNYGPYWVWAPNVVAVMAFKDSVQPIDKMPCSAVSVSGGNTRLVVGTPEQVMRKLNRRY